MNTHSQTGANLALARERGRNTVKLHIKQLVAAGQLVLHGRGRGAWYALR